MKFLCVLEKDGKITLPELILSQLPKNKRHVIEMEFNDKIAEKFELKEISSFNEEGVPIPYDALEESHLMDESHLRVLVMDRAIIITCEDKILEMMAEECFK
ncbi:MAG: hypothetical protein E7192_01840 [Erysipelotrichaceae bacterium]|nr:hypothetical protein [Erysipelotrichaceae bacterium]